MKTELITTLKRQATKLLKKLREEKEPVLITKHGKPSAYQVDVDHFEQIQKKLRLLAKPVFPEWVGAGSVDRFRLLYKLLS